METVGFVRNINFSSFRGSGARSLSELQTRTVVPVILVIWTFPAQSRFVSFQGGSGGLLVEGEGDQRTGNH